MLPKQLVVFGFGGHARSVADVALSAGVSELLFVDANAREGENFLGHAVVPVLPPSLNGEWGMFPASGNGEIRAQQCARIHELGLVPVCLVSPSASLGTGATVEEGCFVGHHAHIGPMAHIGRGCIINTAAVVEHESRVGSFSHVSVNATMAGRSSLGALSMLGAAAVIIDGIEVGDRIVIGAGAVVHRPIRVPGTYAGVPATRIHKGAE